MENIKVAVALSSNRALKGKIVEPDKEKRDKLYNEFNRSFENYEAEPEEFMRKIADGFAYTSQHNGWRHSRNFIRAQHLALDLDDTGVQLEQLVDIPFFQRFASFAHTTPSHTKDNPRLRVVFVLDRPIPNQEKYAELAQSLVARFGMSDQTCKDPARFFYGSLGCETLWFGNVMTLEDAAAELVLPYRKDMEKARLEAEEKARNMVVVPAEGVSEARLRAHSQKLLRRIMDAPKGEKHITRLNIARTFGGYIAGGYYNMADARSWLEAAVRANTTNFEAAMQTIEDGLAYGMQSPLYFEQENIRVVDAHRDEYPELDGISQPLTTAQRIQVVAIIKEREWKAYHDGMTAAQRGQWYAHGLDDNLIDMLNLGVRGEWVDPETGEMFGQSLTVPFASPDGDVVNVEYRGESSVSYASSFPSLYYPEMTNLDTPLLVFGDTLRGINGYLQIGAKFRVAALPEMSVIPDTFKGEKDAIIVVEPGVDLQGRGIKSGMAKYIQVPFPIDKMLAYGMTIGHLWQFVNNARVIS